MINPRFQTMTSPQGGHLLHYLTWGEPRDTAVLCVHGLARNARDFDFLAQALARNHFVVCVDVVGRGESGWLADPDQYGYPQYLVDLYAVMTACGLKTVDWIGTSMGGLLGMIYASAPDAPNQPHVRSLVLNDIGYRVPSAALKRIADYLHPPARFADLDAAEAYFRQALVSFGTISDEHWAHLARHGVRVHPDGGFVVHYDPAITTTFAAVVDEDLDLHPYWTAVRCPVLLLHGADSDVLPEDIARDMATRPRVKRVEFSHVGHAPTLMPTNQIRAVVDWLKTTSP